MKCNDKVRVHDQVIVSGVVVATRNPVESLVSHSTGMTWVHNDFLEVLPEPKVKTNEA